MLNETVVTLAPASPTGIATMQGYDADNSEGLLRDQGADNSSPLNPGISKVPAGVLLAIVLARLIAGIPGPYCLSNLQVPT